MQCKAKTANAAGKADKGFFGLFGSKAKAAGTVDTGVYYMTPEPEKEPEVPRGAWKERPILPDGDRSGY
jgi:hypothetical protein